MPLGLLESLCSLYAYIHFWQAFSWTAMFFIVYNKLHRVKKGSWTGHVLTTKPSRDHRKLGPGCTKKFLEEFVYFAVKICQHARFLSATST